MRLTDSDRERLIELLGQQAAAGAIDLTELEQRVERVMSASSREQAAAVLGDLPVRLSGRAAGRWSLHWGRGHGHAEFPQPDWRATSERFRDPTSGRVMRVWVDAGGLRHYVVDEPAE